MKGSSRHPRILVWSAVLKGLHTQQKSGGGGGSGRGSKASMQ